MAGKKTKARTLSDVAVGSVEQRALLAELHRDLQRYDVEAVEYVSHGIDWLDRQKRQKTETGVDNLNRLYAKGLMMECVRPLQHGADSRSVAQAVGMFTAAYLMNRDFRREIDQGVTNALYPYVKKKADKAEPGSAWARRLERIETARNDGRMPLTARSAAVMKLALTKKAYRDVRMSDDPKKVMDEYNKSVETLFSLAEADGVDPQAMKKNVRTLVGHMVRQDPSNAQFFDQLAYDRVVRAPGELKADGSRVWTGQYIQKDGSSYDGNFGPRLPMDAEERSRTIYDSLKEGFDQCHTAEDVTRFARAACGEQLSDDVKAAMPWTEGWQERFQWKRSMSLSDCRSQEDEDGLFDAMEAHTKTLFSEWAKAHPKEMSKMNRRTGGPKTRPEAQAGPELVTGGSDFEME